MELEIDKVYAKIVECTICKNQLTSQMASLQKCGHVFHYNCIEKYIKSSQKCPMCKIKCNAQDIIKIVYNLEDIEENEGFKEEYLEEKKELEQKNKVLEE